MSDGGRPPATIAQSPFDDVDADIILHTSDNVDFRVFRSILTLSSPLFQAMFTLPQPSDALARAIDSSASAHEKKKGLSDGAVFNPLSVNVPEDSLTLDTLLRFLYPNTHVPSFHDLLHARNVAIVASKYDMSAALDKIADKVQTQYVASHPLHVYFVACRMGWEGVAKAAAKYCLDPATTGNDSDDGEVMQNGLLDYPGAAVAYHRLQEYRGAFRKALEKEIDCAKLSKSSWPSNCGEKGISGYCLSVWSTEYITNMLVAVSRCPRKETLGDSSLVPGTRCNRCNVYLAPTIAKTQLKLASMIEDVLFKVELRFGS